MSNKQKSIGAALWIGTLAVVGASLLLTAILALASFITQWAWNVALVPQGLQQLTLLQAFALNILGSAVSGKLFSFNSKKEKQS